ncbi:molybdenum cofactor guanylyltransferase MobA [Jannaschia aquimarina]|uniref:molybdenum cofactor guanylyltransferase MobA n=1 Tax=Jannaschia aquimarina TaxID=935700 RepID=UPI000A9148BB|nr:molybdenum cofactor guanylyltransferase MobA [Jannaschia aquimarina]
MSSRSDIPAVVLAGGLARRMGGGDKGRLMLAGKPILTHVLDRLSPQVGRVAINANGDSARWDEFGLPVLPDTVPDYPGPLAGVLAGLDWAADQGAEAIVSAAADTPFLPSDLVPGLLSARGPSGLVLARAGRPQPTFGLWPVALREDLRSALASGTRKILHWTDAHGATYADFPEDAFFNVNTPEDLQAAEVRA